MSRARWMLPLVFLMSVVGLSLGVVLAIPRSAHAAESSICDATTGRFSAVQSFTPTSDAIARATNATAWMKSMMNASSGATGDGSRINPATRYDYNYTGATTGTFQLAAPRATTTGSPLHVTSPGVVSDTYRGVVTGIATLPSAGSYEVRAYLTTDTQYEQAEAIPAVVAADGSWTIDLSFVPTTRAGAWNFALIDSATSTRVGEYWPQVAHYTDLVVELYSVTDGEYFVASQPALADNTFVFAESNTGTKLIRLKDTATNTTLAQYYEPSGLIRSYELMPGEPGYGTNFAQRTAIYDQALALLVATAQHDTAWARQLIEGLKLAQATTGAQAGGFAFSMPQLSPVSAEPIYRTGANAVVAYALLRYEQAYPGDASVRAMTESSLDYLMKQRAASGDRAGLYVGGSGRDTGGVVDGNYQIPWVSTEHNIDMWHALSLAGLVLDDARYTDAAHSLQTTIMEKLWNPALNRFNQGYDDTANTLDINSWGAIFLLATGEYDKAASSLTQTDGFKTTAGGATGYTPYLAASGYPGATPTVWHEGSFGVAQAKLLHGSPNDAATIVTLASPSQESNGAWRYASVADPIYEIGASRSVASTAWFLLAATHPAGIWSECVPITASSATGASTVPLAQTGASPIDYGVGAAAIMFAGVGVIVQRKKFDA